LVLSSSSSIAGKGVRVTFDGGRLTSDAGVLVLANIERRLGIAERLARCLTDPRSPERVHHTLVEMIRFRVLLIAAGYPDANDCDALRSDPAFKMAVGHLPESGRALCSQPTMCRLENLPTVTALKRMMAAMVELFCDSFSEVPRRIVLDIDDTEDRVHGRQELALFHAHYDEYCFLPIHVYEAITGKPVAVILRPGKTPDGAEVALVLRHIIRAIRRRWPRVDILVRGDSHYGRPEAMSWCERERVGYVFGLAGNKVLLKRAAGLAEEVAMRRVGGEAAKVRRYGEFAYAAQTWHTERRVIARVEASDKGADSRFVVTNLAGTPRWLYEAVYCARGQAEKSGEGPQAPPRLGPDLVQQGHRQPVPPRAAHGRLLAPAHPARLGTEAVLLARGPARHAPLRAGQGGRPGDRAGEPDRARAAVRLPLPGQPDVPRHPGCKTALSRGAACPDRACPPQPPAPILASSGATVRHARGQPVPAASLTPVNNPG
jgi:hypothetical protein